MSHALSQQSILNELYTQYRISYESIQDLKNGQNLICLVNKILYNNENEYLKNKVLNNPSNKAGNNVININVLLKYLKADKQIMKNSPQRILQLSFFHLLQDQHKLIMFIKWIMQKGKSLSHQIHQQISDKQRNYIQSPQIDMWSHQNDQINSLSSNRFRNINIKDQHNIIKHKKTQTSDDNKGFENLYFASNIKEKLQDIQSPVKDQVLQGDKIVRKGSFKLLKPKVNFNQDINQQVKQLQTSPSKPTNNQIQHLSMIQPQQLKQISMIQGSLNHANTIDINSSNIYIIDQQMQKQLTTTPLQQKSLSKDNIEHKKTIPKNIGKPPLAKSAIKIKNKENSSHKMEVQKTKKDKPFFNLQYNKTQNVSSFTADQLMINNHWEIQNHHLNLNHQMSLNYNMNSNHHHMNSNIHHMNSNHHNVKKTLSHQKSQQKSQIRSQLKNHQRNSSFDNDEDININNDRVESIKLNKKQLSFQSLSITKLLQLKNKQLIQQLSLLQSQISRQNLQLQAYNSAPIQKKYAPTSNKYQSNPQNNKSSSKLSKSRSNSIRKVFKVQIKNVDQIERDWIIQWLRKNMFVGKDFSQDNILQVFANGHLFVNIANYYVGRGKQLSSFNHPKKNAEIHSNFNHLFQFLKTISTFQCQVLDFYQFFIPQPQQNAIWSLLMSMFSAFERKNILKKYKNESFFRQQQKIMKQQNQSQRYNSIKKKPNKQKTQTVIINKQKQRNKQQLKRQNSKKSNNKKQIQFVNQIPQQLKHKDLVQNIQPQTNQKDNNFIEQGNFMVNGYIQRYFRKNYISKSRHTSSHNKFGTMTNQTPKKQIQIIEKSILMNNERNLTRKPMISSSKKSLEKSLQKGNSQSRFMHKNLIDIQKGIKIPKVSLKMQLQAQKWLISSKIMSQNYLNNKSDLLNDCIRNGIYLCRMINSNEKSLKYFINPKSIENCRQNYSIALNQIKLKYGQQGNHIYHQYFPFVQNIIKGQISLFFAIVYKVMHKINIPHLINYQVQKQQNVLKQQKQRLSQVVTQFQNDYISWIRYLESIDPHISMLKIRNIENLKQYISSGYFLYCLTEMILMNGSHIKPVYGRPVNVKQRQSNLKKILTYLTQNNILSKQSLYVGIQRELALKQVDAIQCLIHLLIPLTLQKQKLPQLIKQCVTNRPINVPTFIPDNKQRLQTTCDLQQQRQQILIQDRHEAIQQVQIPWVRKLGFTNCSLNINNGVVLCRLLSKITRTNIPFNQQTSHQKLTKPQCLANIRKALKILTNIKYDQLDVYQADVKVTFDIYNFIRDKFKHSYEMKRLIA